MQAKDPITDHFRLTPIQKGALKKLRLATIEDLLRHLPSRYEIPGERGSAGTLVPGTKVTLYGTVTKLEAKKLWKSRRNATEGVFEDGSGKVRLMWFNQPYIASYVSAGSFVKLVGTVGGTSEKPYIANPEIETTNKDAVTEGLFAAQETAVDSPTHLFPIYPESSGITSRWFYHALERVFKEDMHHALADVLPLTVREKLHLPELADALMWIHRPEKQTHTEAARKRFAFEEMFVIQAARAQERNENTALAAYALTNTKKNVEQFLSTIPFPPTGAQRRAIADITNDLEKAHPMARLLEGDVGSGKTLVAAASAYAAITCRPPGKRAGTLQVAYMAPTEILAGQHFQSFIEYFKDAPVNIALITGSGCKKFPSKVAKGQATSISRTQLLKWVANGEIAMVVGTHALIQKSVEFQHLALAMVDEQHRFGTAQRRALAHRGACAPHFLSMTATPIPRTLALTMYGDLDISVLDELPPGRAKITTRVVSPATRNEAYDAIRSELKKGRQAYVICPRIEEPDPEKMNALQAKSAKAEAKRLAKEVFPEYTVGLLHGAMKPAEKDAEMARFASGAIHVLVATSVVEVGVNVPNATVILIEGAERFGLAQLHQLRGRVQRSSYPPLCFLLAEQRGAVSGKRLKVLADSSDGFVLAEEDLKTRGMGDLYGRSQSGISDIGMEALKNPRLIAAARTEAQTLVSIDPTLSMHPALLSRVTSSREELHTE
jgi:ATP-dependent DNA helicase RecG